MIGLFGDLSSLLVTLLVALVGIIYVWYLAKKVLSNDAGTELMQKISNSIHQGAMAFLGREYRTIAYFVLVVALIIFFAIARKTALAFVVGAACSIAAGFIGMQIATKSNARTAQAAAHSFNQALGIAFPGGAVMGLSVVSLGLFGLTAVYWLFIGLSKNPDLVGKIVEATNLIVGFSLGAS